MSWVIIAIVLPFIIGMIGEVFKKLALPGKMPVTGWTGWRGVYYVTFPAHSLFAGVIFGLFMFKAGVPWPTDVFGTNLGSAVLAGCFSGGVAVVAYDTIVKTIKRAITQVALKKNEEQQ